MLPPVPHSRRQRLLGTGPYWLVQICVWVVFVGGLDLVTYFMTEGTLRAIGVWAALAFGFEMTAGTHLSRWLLLTLRRRHRSSLTFGLAALACSPLCGLVTAAIGTILTGYFGSGWPVSWTGWIHTAYNWLYYGSVNAFGWLAAYACWTLLHSYHTAETSRLRSEAAAKEAELIALKAQINPHFLFNSLNTLRSLLPREQKVPREAITKLAELLRSALTVQANTTIPLRQELATVESYLALEQLRFEERLRVRRDISRSSLDREIPPFALQALVENAVKFGIGSSVDGGEIHISVLEQPTQLRLCVTNPGRIGVTSTSTGLGLRNTRARLHHIYGDKARLTLSQVAPDLVAAELLLPAPAP